METPSPLCRGFSPLDDSDGWYLDEPSRAEDTTLPVTTVPVNPNSAHVDWGRKRIGGEGISDTDVNVISGRSGYTYGNKIADSLETTAANGHPDFVYSTFHPCDTDGEFYNQEVGWRVEGHSVEYKHDHLHFELPKGTLLADGSTARHLVVDVSGFNSLKLAAMSYETDSAHETKSAEREPTNESFPIIVFTDYHGVQLISARVAKDIKATIDGLGPAIEAFYGGSHPETCSIQLRSDLFPPTDDGGKGDSGLLQVAPLWDTWSFDLHKDGCAPEHGYTSGYMTQRSVREAEDCGETSDEGGKKEGLADFVLFKDVQHETLWQPWTDDRASEENPINGSRQVLDVSIE